MPELSLNSTLPKQKQKAWKCFEKLGQKEIMDHLFALWIHPKKKKK